MQSVRRATRSSCASASATSPPKRSHGAASHRPRPDDPHQPPAARTPLSVRAASPARPGACQLQAMQCRRHASTLAPRRRATHVRSPGAMRPFLPGAMTGWRLGTIRAVTDETIHGPLLGTMPAARPGTTSTTCRVRARASTHAATPETGRRTNRTGRTGTILATTRARRPRAIHAWRLRTPCEREPRVIPAPCRSRVRSPRRHGTSATCLGRVSEACPLTTPAGRPAATRARHDRSNPTRPDLAPASVPTPGLPPGAARTRAPTAARATTGTTTTTTSSMPSTPPAACGSPSA